MHAGEMFPSPRALRAARIAEEVKRARANNRLPTVAEVQARYQFTEAAAEKFIHATKRALQKPPTTKTSKSSPRTKEPNVPPPELTPTTVSSAHYLKAVLDDIRRRFGDEIRQRGEQTSVKEGFVYLVTHPCFEGWVKAGMTIDYELRLGTYNVADPLSRFEMVTIKWVKNRREAETLLLEALRPLSKDIRGEWARIPLDLAIVAFHAIDSDPRTA